MHNIFLESSSDEDSVVNEDIMESTPEREKARDRSIPHMLPPPPLSDTSSTGSPPPLHHRSRMPPPQNWDFRNKNDFTDISEVMHNFRPCKKFYSQFIYILFIFALIIISTLLDSC